jgi:hypothetical protein
VSEVRILQVAYMLTADAEFETLLGKRIWNHPKTRQGTITKLYHAPIEDRDDSFDIVWDGDTEPNDGPYFHLWRTLELVEETALT